MTRLERAIARRTDELVHKAHLVDEGYAHLAHSESVRYVISAMQPIDGAYTKNTYDQGDRVCNQLDRRLATSCEYEYQGSVTNDTHVKARSDIDVLLLTTRFETLERPQVASPPYNGNVIQDLIDLREDAIACLESAFPEAKVDSSGSKSITVEGGSLRRRIDVVPSNWYNTNDYAATGNKMLRGVQVLDAKARQRLKNTPFLHNERIDEMDGRTAGCLRKAARLMKSLKYDTEKIDLSSYDIVSIAYNMPEWELTVPRSEELRILDACFEYCVRLVNDVGERMAIDVPDGHRKVFAAGHATVDGLRQLALELGKLKQDVLNENRRSFAKLREARVEY